MKAVRTSSARHRVRCRLARPLARDFKFLGELLVSSDVHQSAGLGYSLGGGDAAQRIDATEINPCCRPGNLD